ncbi:hypothetical protein H0O00_03965 [Candidatus Micrarchaeota archaeon]|nr:hypothetical protein [Candidatus Micrarchaeota archaeon]
MRDRTGRRPRNDAPPQETRSMVLDYLEERFGLAPETFRGFGLYLASKGRVYLGPERAIGEPRVVSVGITIARLSGTVKPSTNLIQLFGRQMTRNVIPLEKEEAVSYAKGEDIRLPAERLSHVTEGYVSLGYADVPLGCGMLKDGSIRNMLPKAKRLGLKFI